MIRSQQRADAVRAYLIEQGDTKPVGPNDTEEGKFHNPRIEFSLR
jgi:outer membrane protein OmpA-like peptidoglycan-associated protein